MDKLSSIRMLNGPLEGFMRCDSVIVIRADIWL